MAQSLGQMAVESIVKLKENGTSVNYIVVHQGRPSSSYDTSCDGTWLLRQDIAENRVWDSGNSNVLESSDIQSYLNGTWINRYDTDIRNAIKQVKIPYRQNGGSGGTDRNGANGLSCKIFLLSGREVGWDSADNQYFPNDGAKLDYFLDETGSSANSKRVATLNGSATRWWLRSPHTNSTGSVWLVYSNGDYSSWSADSSCGVRPALVLPSTLLVSDDGSISMNTAPTAPENLTVPNQADKGGSVAISWSASTDADENLSGYTLQRSVNGGGFTQVYQGANTSFTDTAPANADTLQYRVQAYDSGGVTSGWTTSTQFPVYGIPNLTVPQMVMQGQSATISWSAISEADSYTLQRKSSADADWTQVYSGANLSYSETVGTWTSLQYRVCAVFGETSGGWATSGDIQIVAASALAISGSDGDLGTLTSDVSYSVSSDQTSPTIDVTVEVNGGEYASFQATSGQNYSIGVLDLPTGTGNITITATTTVSSSPVSVTRTWTYTKTAQTFPAAGSVGRLTQEGAVVWPETIAEAVRAGTPWGGNMSTALSLLQKAALYNRTQTPKYSEVTVNMANVTEGQIVSIPRGGVMVPHYVAKLEYESGLNGAGRRLLVPVECYDKRAWGSGNVNAYATSDIDAWMNSTYKALFPEEIQTAMGTTEFYYTPGNGNTTVSTLERSIFALSVTELGESNNHANVEGSALPIASTLRIAYQDGITAVQWTRTPYTFNLTHVFRFLTDGALSYGNCNQICGSRPAFTLPSTFSATYYVDQGGGIHDAQEYTEAGDWLDVWGNDIPTVKIETGSYTGTGTYGSGDPNMLVLQERPKLIFISDFGSFTQMVYMDNQKEQTSFSPNGIVFYLSGMPTILEMYVFMSENKFQWYSDSNASNQLNQSGHEYSYTAIY